ncbi:MarR family winged helix-turn-helix transcriptional regulator [Glaciihabitans sp. dw_435]|uniref:MarR family winged helix-turn-helix transcriptional regulator n=1 Tax=Glaciihabitans sp. dw_435 TaxID=2720081 RepID=UPI001BD4C705|nr:MarR family transcriptional regulator [Glaciihabitans sp. dw_435]
MSSGRRSPNAHELRVWREFIETGDRLRSLLGSRLQSESDLSTGDYSVLLALSEATGKRMRPSDLASHISWERSRLSHHLGRMESRGLVGREKCLTDNRGTEIVLTESGARLFRQASAPHLRAVHELFITALDPELLAKADDVTRALRDHLDGRSLPDPT